MLCAFASLRENSFGKKITASEVLNDGGKH